MKDISIETCIHELTQQLQSKHVGIQILSARSWYLPIEEIALEYWVEEKKTFNIIEKFILKLVDEGMESVEGICKIMQLPKFLLQCYVARLQSYGVLGEAIPLALTQKGEESYRHDQSVIARVPRTKVTYVPKGMTKEYDEDLLENYSLIGSKLQKSPYYLGQRDYEFLVDKKTMNDCTYETRATSYGVGVIEIWVYDELEEKYYCKVWQLEEGAYHKELGQWLTEHVEPVIEEVEVSEEYSYIQEKLQQGIGIEEPIKYPLKEMMDKYNQKAIAQIQVVRGKDIKPAFMDAITKTKKQLIIFSPWMSEKVIDQEMIMLFEKLVRKGAKIFLGWGIGRSEAEEDRVPEAGLLERLSTICDDKGECGITVCWVGNNHSKEVVVDDKIHISGSFNFLSYRGDYRPRGESVTVVTIPQCVQEAKQHWEEVFESARKSKNQCEGVFDNIQ